MDKRPISETGIDRKPQPLKKETFASPFSKDKIAALSETVGLELRAPVEKHADKTRKAAQKYLDNLMANGESRSGHIYDFENYLIAQVVYIESMGTLYETPNNLQGVSMKIPKLYFDKKAHGYQSLKIVNTLLPETKELYEEMKKRAETSLSMQRRQHYLRTHEPEYKKHFENSQDSFIKNESILATSKNTKAAVQDAKKLSLKDEEALTAKKDEIEKAQQQIIKDLDKVQRLQVEDTKEAIENIRWLIRRIESQEKEKKETAYQDDSRFKNLNKSHLSFLKRYKSLVKEVSEEMTNNNPLVRSYQEDYRAFMGRHHGFIKSIAKLLTDLQEGKEMPSISYMELIKKDAKHFFADPLLSKLKNKYGKLFGSGLFNMNPDDGALRYSVHRVNNSLMSELAFSNKNLAKELKSNRESIKQLVQLVAAITKIDGSPDSFKDLAKNAGKSVAILTGAVAGAVALGALTVSTGFTGAGFAAVAGKLMIGALVSGVGAGIGGQITQWAIEDHYELDEKVMAKAIGQSVMYSALAGVGGIALGQGAGRLAARLAKSNSALSQSAARLAKKYSDKMIKDALRVQSVTSIKNTALRTDSFAKHILEAGKQKSKQFLQIYKNYFKKFMAETREEAEEELAQQFGASLFQTDDPALGFLFAILPHSSRMGRHTFVQQTGRFNLTSTITAQINKAGLDLKCTDGKDVQQYLSSKGVDESQLTDIAERLNSGENVEINIHGLNINMSKDHQPEAMRLILQDTEALQLAKNAGLEFNRANNTYTYSNGGRQSDIVKLFTKAGFQVEVKGVNINISSTQDGEIKKYEIEYKGKITWTAAKARQIKKEISSKFRKYENKHKMQALRKALGNDPRKWMAVNEAFEGWDNETSGEVSTLILRIYKKTGGISSEDIGAITRLQDNGIRIYEFSDFLINTKKTNPNYLEFWQLIGSSPKTDKINWFYTSFEFMHKGKVEKLEQIIDIFDKHDKSNFHYSTYITEAPWELLTGGSMEKLKIILEAATSNNNYAILTRLIKTKVSEIEDIEAFKFGISILWLRFDDPAYSNIDVSSYLVPEVFRVISLDPAKRELVKSMVENHKLIGVGPGRELMNFLEKEYLEVSLGKYFKNEIKSNPKVLEDLNQLRPSRSNAKQFYQIIVATEQIHKKNIPKIKELFSDKRRDRSLRHSAFFTEDELKEVQAYIKTTQDMDEILTLAGSSKTHPLFFIRWSEKFNLDPNKRKQLFRKLRLVSAYNLNLEQEQMEELHEYVKTAENLQEVLDFLDITSIHALFFVKWTKSLGLEPSAIESLFEKLENISPQTLMLAEAHMEDYKKTEEGLEELLALALIGKGHIFFLTKAAEIFNLDENERRDLFEQLKDLPLKHTNAFMTNGIQELEEYQKNLGDFKDIQALLAISREHILLLIKWSKEFDLDAAQRKNLSRELAKTNGNQISGIQKMLEASPNKMSLEKNLIYMGVMGLIGSSPSQEIQRIGRELSDSILESEDPVESWRKIEEVFIKNNLPLVGKIFKIFEVLHSDQQMALVLEGSDLSPYLTAASPKRRKYTIFTDLLRVHIESGNRSLRNYLQILQEGEGLFELLDGTDKQISPTELRQLQHYITKLNTLLVASPAKHEGEEVGSKSLSIEDIRSSYEVLKRSLGVRKEQTVNERVVELFGSRLGYETIPEILEAMESKKKVANLRGMKMARIAKDGKLSLEEGDLVKGVDAKFITSILQRGSVSKEYLGSASSSDATPYDTDVAKITEAKDFTSTLNGSMASSYGNILFVIKNRGQFVETSADSKNIDPSKLELFSAGYSEHYGIRTGFPTTEIDYMISREGNNNKLFLEIAQNGYYIPVVDLNGEIIFTPDDYKKLRKIYDGLDYYEGADYEFQPTLPSETNYSEIDRIASKLDPQIEQTKTKSAQIYKAVEEVLASFNIHLKDEYDTSLLGAELIDTGSTSRYTNLDDGFDFDLALRLDLEDQSKIPEIVSALRAKLKPKTDNSHGGNSDSDLYQLRFEGAAGLGSPADIDIAFIKKSELVVYGSHDAVKAKLEWIKEHKGDEAYKQVVANIILAKKILKDGKAYKKFEHGGLGGIGVENWILANGGNFQQAVRSFLEAAHENGEVVPFQVFQKKYPIIDPGINVKFMTHDNFAFVLKEEGYKAMLSVFAPK